MTAPVRTPTAPDQQLSATVEQLLDPTASHDLWQGRGTIAVVRGFDKDSRNFHRAVLRAAATHGWSVTDVPAAPTFGSIPWHTDVQLVVAARASLRAVAERCAAHWGAHVICPETASDGADWQARPAASLALLSEGGSDSVASSLHITGPVHYKAGEDDEGTATALVIEPCESGALVTADGENGTHTIRITDGSLSITLGEPARATLDGHPQLLPDGDYTVTPRPAAFRHLVAGVPAA
ncbi:hypothetical protein [Haloechinothrix halophila]|uniref:Uncharacterized protein n=1 Tax=Haloechinothrix halophila YIM 93223 TaxID=592678 RepID=W9DN28_9PSEU|nr:hypothetical protein [Haloechinothrix halophila]ETA66278.1 hypothetical protein AmyhaDRAFT_0031 [Haloechinothrix halophila YIM 93223]